MRCFVIKRSRASAATRYPAACWCCGQTGHLLRQCPVVKKNRMSQRAHTVSDSPRGSGKFVPGRIGTFVVPLSEEVSRMVVGKVKIAGIDVDALVDTGATMSCCRLDWYRRYQSFLGPMKKTTKTVIGVGSSPAKVSGLIENILVEWDQVCGYFSLIVLPELDNIDVVLGMDILTSMDVTIEAKAGFARPSSSSGLNSGQATVARIFNVRKIGFDTNRTLEQEAHVDYVRKFFELETVKGRRDGCVPEDHCGQRSKGEESCDIPTDVEAKGLSSLDQTIDMKAKDLQLCPPSLNQKIVALVPPRNRSERKDGISKKTDAFSFQEGLFYPFVKFSDLNKQERDNNRVKLFLIKDKDNEEFRHNINKIRKGCSTEEKRKLRNKCYSVTNFEANSSENTLISSVFTKTTNYFGMESEYKMENSTEYKPSSMKIGYMHEKIRKKLLNGIGLFLAIFLFTLVSLASVGNPAQVSSGGTIKGEPNHREVTLAMAREQGACCTFALEMLKALSLAY